MVTSVPKKLGWKCVVDGDRLQVGGSVNLQRLYIIRRAAVRERAEALSIHKNLEAERLVNHGQVESRKVLLLLHRKVFLRFKK